jgi:hypothetical protein
MKTTPKLAVKAVLALILVTASLPLTAFGQDKDKNIGNPPDDEMFFWFYNEDDDPAYFPLPDPDEINVPDSNEEMEIPFDDEGMPDPRMIRSMERALREMHQAMRRLDREMWRLKHMHSEAWERMNPGRDEFFPMPPAPERFRPPFPGPRRFLKGRPGQPDSLVFKSDTLTKIIIVGGKQGDTIVRKTVRILKKNDGKDADTIIMERIMVPGRHHQMPPDARMPRRAPGPLKTVDLSQEDLNRLAKSALAPAAAAEPLGIAQIRVRPAGKDALHLAFPARDLTSFDVSLYDDSGALIFQESIKKNSGDYARRIETGSKPPFFLKITQGKKTLLKKIIPDR